MNLFIDTETTGKFNFKLPATDPSQPRIVQIAAMIADDAGEQLGAFTTLIQPDGWTIPSDAAAIHGISTERCQNAGIPVTAALEMVWHLSQRCRRVVAHNIDFDSAMLVREADVVNKTTPIFGLEFFCTMHEATDILKLPGNYGRFKWPSLAEAHRHFFQTDFDGAHNAMADVIACKKIFYAMTKPNNPVEAIENDTMADAGTVNP